MKKYIVLIFLFLPVHVFAQRPTGQIQPIDSLSQVPVSFLEGYPVFNRQNSSVYVSDGDGWLRQLNIIDALSSLIIVREDDGSPQDTIKILSFDNGTVSFTADTAFIANSGGGSGTMTTVKESNSQIGDADIVTIDFGSGFDLVETPDTEINIDLDLSELGSQTLFPGLAASYTWSIDLSASDWSMLFEGGTLRLQSASLRFDNDEFIVFENALGGNDATFITRASDDDMQLKNGSDSFEFIVINDEFDFRNDATVVHRLTAGSGNDTYFNTPVAINKTSITGGIELDVSGDIHAAGNITLTGTVDGVDIAARDHDSVTLAGTYDYLTIAGQVITRNQIDAATDITGLLPDGNIASTIHRDSETKDGDLVSFDDVDSKFVSTNVDDALSELNNVDDAANDGDGMLHWTNFEGVPADILDGDDGITPTAGYLIDIAGSQISVDPTEDVNWTFGDGTQASATHTIDLSSGDINWQYSANAIQLGANMSFVRSSSGNPVLTLENNNDDANAASFWIAKYPATANDNDAIGNIVFAGKNSIGTEATQYGKIVGYSSDVTSGTEDGRISFSVLIGGSSTEILNLNGGANTVFMPNLQLTDGDVLVDDGGTGTSSLTDGGVLFGSGTSAITASSVLTNGQLLIGDGSGDPTLATLTEGSGVSIVNGAGSITISSTLGTAINSAEITDGTILPVDLAGTPVDEYILTYESTGATFEYQTIASFFTEGEGIDFSGTTNLTIDGENASTSNKGIASFNSSHFSVASGAVSLNHQTTITSSSVALPRWTFENNNGDPTGSFLYFKKDGGSPANNDNIGNIYFTGEDSLNSAFTVAKIEVDQDDYTTGDGAGRIDFFTSINGSLTNIFSLDGYTDAVGRGEVEINRDQGDVDFVLNSDLAEVLRMHGDDGDIGIGTTSNPQGLMHLKEVAGSDNLVLESNASSTSDNTDHGQMAWYTTVNSVGKLARILVESDGSWSGGDESSSMIFSTMQNTTLNRRLEIRANGNIEDGSGGTFHTVSDSTLKTNIRTIENALDLIGKMRGVTFNWKESGKYETGLIAQEVQEVIPSAVSKRDDGLLGIEERELIGVLVQSINELNEKIKRLEKKLEK